MKLDLDVKVIVVNDDVFGRLENESRFIVGEGDEDRTHISYDPATKTLSIQAV